MQISTLLSLIVLGTDALRLDDLPDGVTAGVDGDLNPGASVTVTDGLEVTVD